jgi:hypothetical protein
VSIRLDPASAAGDELEAPAQLMSQAVGQLQPHRRGGCGVEVLGNADAVVLYHHVDDAIDATDRDLDGSAAAFGKCVLEAVGHQFVRQQPEGRGAIEAELNVFRIQPEMDLAGFRGRLRLLTPLNKSRR